LSPEVTREGAVEKRITKWTPLPVRHSFPLLHRRNLHCFHTDNMAALTYVSGVSSRHLRKTLKSKSEAPTHNVSVCDVLFCECEVKEISERGCISMVDDRIILTY
jgi:hypothetical protein